MNRYIYFFVIYFLVHYSIYPQNSLENYQYRSLSEIWNEADSGKVLGKHSVWDGSERYFSSMLKVFENEYGNKIYYDGAEDNGYGEFYIENAQDEIIIILKTFIKYDSRIIWHGNNIAEIIIPTGSPFTHSYYYNFLENKLSERYNFPMHYDIENNYVLIWGNNDFELYNIITNELIRIYYDRRKNGFSGLFPNISWRMQKENNNIIMYWRDADNNTGKICFEI